VRPRLAQREIALAGVALLAVVASVAFTSGNHKSDGGLPPPSGSWYPALASSRGPGSYGKRTACNIVLRPATVGVSHPVLPCGSKIYVRYAGQKILTQVIDRGPYVPGRQFDLTEALAARLGLHGVQEIEWAFARSS
jgi:rare lipoprotein A